MAIETKVIKVKLYDEATIGRSISYSTQRVGTGEDAGLSSVLTTTALVPGGLDDNIYTRTNISVDSGIPEEVRDIANLCWTEAVYTAHEAKLRG